MEFGCGVAGTKLIVVLGHTHCGAVTAACHGPAEGHIETLLAKIHPAVREARTTTDAPKESAEFIDLVARRNVDIALKQIGEHSPLLSKMESNGDLAIVGGMYDVKTGAVEFFRT